MADSTTTTVDREADSEAKRSITGRLLFFYVLGDVLGAGVYVLIGAVSGAVGGAFWIAFAVGVPIAAITGTPTPSWSPSTPRRRVPPCSSTGVQNRRSRS